jgi:hypothetical protein
LVLASAAWAWIRELRISSPIDFDVGTKVVRQWLADPTSRTMSKYCVSRSKLIYKRGEVATAEH